MKNLVCRFLSICLTLVIVGIFNPIEANAQDASNIEYTKETINSLDDSDFNAFLVEYITENKKNGVSFEEIQNNLSVIDVTVEEQKNEQPEIGLFYVSPLTVDFYIYTAHRGQDTYHRLISTIIFNGYEAAPGALDLLSIEWDPTIASYHSQSAGDYTTYMDGSQRFNGIVLFNVDDYFYYPGYAAYATVNVTPKVTGKAMEIGSKYIHTYDKTNITWSVGVNVGYTDKGPTGGATFSLTGSNVGSSWQTYADNAVTF